MDVMQSHAVKLARRALAEYQQPDDTPRQNGAGYVVVLLAILSLVSIVIIGLFINVELIIIKIASVETSDAAPAIALSNNADKSYNDQTSDDEDRLNTINEANVGLLGNTRKAIDGNGLMAATFQRPLTSSIRQTLSHLRTLGGFRKAYLRGLGHLVLVLNLQTIIQILITIILFVIARSSSGHFDLCMLAGAIAIILVAGPRASVTQAILSATPRSLFQRFPPLRTWKYLVAPTCINLLCSTLVLGIPLAFNMLATKIFPITTLPADNIDGEVAYSAAAIFGVLTTNIISLVIVLALFYHVAIPASITLTRVEASLLPASDETIIPFDRTFGGRVVMTGVDDRLVLRTKDAWRSVTTADRRRVAILLFKLTLISIAIQVAGLAMIYGILWCVSGGDVKTLLQGVVASFLSR